jgi:pyrimidine-nucleoside phosphorylase
MKAASIIHDVSAPRSGVIAAIDAMQVGLTTIALGAGRMTKGEPIDRAVGVMLGAKVGDCVRAGDVLFTVHANDENKLSTAREQLLMAYTWAEKEVKPPPLIYEVFN